VHILFGVLGLVMSRNAAGGILYSRIVGVAYGLLTLMGLVPGLNTTFGLIPIHGFDVILHALIAIAAIYYGSSNLTWSAPPPRCRPQRRRYRLARAAALFKQRRRSRRLVAEQPFMRPFSL
jgi:hypothetical protein